MPGVCVMSVSGHLSCVIWPGTFSIAAYKASMCCAVQATQILLPVPGTWRMARVQHTNVLFGLDKTELTCISLGPVKSDGKWVKTFAAVPEDHHYSQPLILSAYGVLLTSATSNKIAIWHFPDMPD